MAAATWPVSNAEQLSFLFFFYLVEGIDAENKVRARVIKQPYTSLFDGDWELKNPPERRRQLHHHPAQPLQVVRCGPRACRVKRWCALCATRCLPSLPKWAKAQPATSCAAPAHAIDDPTVLTQVVSLVDGLRLDQADSDTKGDLFEHVLRQIKQAGELGQFRTPRHIIRAVVEMVDPKVGETIYDPAAGTAGFLVAAYNHIRLAHSSPASIVEAEQDGKLQRRGLGDKLSATQVSALQNATFFGNDVDPKMVRLATMNLTLRGLPNRC